MRELPPLSPEVAALLAPHRTVLPLGRSVEARAIARAAATVESPEPAVVRSPARPTWVFAAAAGAVIALGAAAYAARAWTGWPASRPARIAPVASNASAPPRALEVDLQTEIDAPATAAPTASPRTKHTAGKAIATMVRPTNAELELLLVARQDVTGRDFAGALAAIAEHARRFRNGSLVEEREALRVNSLAGLGRLDDAQRAAAQFHARFPDSVLLSTFERMREKDR